MRKQERRAWICLTIAAVLLGGVILFGWRFATQGGEWASFYGNTQIYTDGMINRGTVTDREGTVLMECTQSGIIYNDDWTTRVSTVHAVGDPRGNISGGAINVFKSQLIGYDILNGTYDTSQSGKKISLTIDARANAAAYNALNGRTGAVGVFNWKTGEILCMVSTPTFDPAGDLPDDNSTGYYFNNFMDGRVTPGSTFKLVTAAAAIDKLPDIGEFSFECDGVNEFQGVDFTDVNNHGKVDFDEALAVSCNGAFGEITRQLGRKTMKEYAAKAGLTEPVEVNGVKTAKGKFKFPKNDDVTLSWAGIGQADDLVNPCAMMVFVGAIANGGEAVQPTLIKSATFLKEITGGKSMGQYLESSTADRLRSMMRNNVVSHYGEENFPGLEICAKTGTAENEDGASDAWFVGFNDDENAPYAFVVWVENGGYGADAAAPIARTVIETLKEDS